MATELIRKHREMERQRSAEHKRTVVIPDFRHMAPGAARRTALLAWLLAGRAEGMERRIVINRRWCLILKRDPDLQRMVKKGILVQRRMNSGSSSLLHKRSGSFTTYLALADRYGS